jgi:hypothetical protein
MGCHARYVKFVNNWYNDLFNTISPDFVKKNRRKDSCDPLKIELGYDLRLRADE